MDYPSAVRRALRAAGVLPVAVAAAASAWTLPESLRDRLLAIPGSQPSRSLGPRAAIDRRRPGVDLDPRFSLGADRRLVPGRRRGQPAARQSLPGRRRDSRARCARRCRPRPSACVRKRADSPASPPESARPPPARCRAPGSARRGRSPTRCRIESATRMHRPLTIGSPLASGRARSSHPEEHHVPGAQLRGPGRVRIQPRSR